MLSPTSASFDSAFSGLGNRGSLSGSASIPAYLLNNSSNAARQANVPITIALPSGNYLFTFSEQYSVVGSAWYQSNGNYYAHTVGQTYLSSSVKVSGSIATIIVNVYYFGASSTTSTAFTYNYKFNYYVAPF